MPSSTKELHSLVIKAQEATKNLDEDLRRVAFERVLEHLLGSCGSPGTVTGTRQDTAQDGGGVAEAADDVFAGEQQRIDALAHYFKISPEEVQQIFDVSGENPRLALPSSKLPKPKSAATHQITLLIAGALTALGQEATSNYIRGIADEHDKLDSPNFMGTLGKVPGISLLGRHGSSNRVVRMKVTGAEAAQDLAKQIFGE